MQFFFPRYVLQIAIPGKWSDLRMVSFRSTEPVRCSTICSGTGERPDSSNSDLDIQRRTIFQIACFVFDRVVCIGTPDSGQHYVLLIVPTNPAAPLTTESWLKRGTLRMQRADVVCAVGKCDCHMARHLRMQKRTRVCYLARHNGNRCTHCRASARRRGAKTMPEAN